MTKIVQLDKVTNEGLTGHSLCQSFQRHHEMVEIQVQPVVGQRQLVSSEGHIFQDDHVLIREIATNVTAVNVTADRWPVDFAGRRVGQQEQRDLFVEQYFIAELRVRPEHVTQHGVPVFELDDDPVMIGGSVIAAHGDRAI